MSKFVVVKSAPEKLEKGELVVTQPDFLEEIRANSRKQPKHGLTGVAYLREVLTSIGQKYDQEMNIFKFPLHKYEGIAFKTEADLSALFNRILKTEHPKVFDKYLEYQLKNRPIATKLIYYVGDFNTTAPFYAAGIDMIEEKDVDSYMTGKPKRVVGKPAITKEEADSRGSEG